MSKKILDVCPRHVRAFILRAAGIPQTEIAERLGTTQGQIASWLKELSEGLLGAGSAGNLGNRLIDQHGQLTRIGEWLKPQLEQLDSAIRNLEKQTSPNRQVLGFCKPCTGLMNAVVQKLSKSDQSQTTDKTGGFGGAETQFDLVADSSRTLLKALVAGRVDVAIVTSEVLESFRADASHHKRTVPLVSHGSFKQRSKLFAASSNRDPILLRAKTRLNDEESIAFFTESKPRWIWYEPKYLPKMRSKIAQYMTDHQGLGFRVSYPVHDLESLHVCILSNRGVSILPESIAEYRYPGIKAYDLPQDFPTWEFEIVRHESNSHELITSTCCTLLEIVTDPSSASAKG